MLPSLPIIHCMPFIGAQALYKIATLDPQGGEPFGTSKKGKDIIYPLHAAPIDEVFGDTAPAEAMFVCYRRRSGGPLPRLTKACEGRIDLVCDYGAFDLDLNAQFGVKGKLSWTALGEERTEIIMGRTASVLDALAAEDAYPICYYRSKNGLRFVHLFHEPVTVAGLELLYRRLAPIYAKAGLTVDASCFDWTRCFKVPRCTLEDGTVTDQQPWFDLTWTPDAVTIVTPEEVTTAPAVGYAGDITAEARLEVSHAREAIEHGNTLTPDGLLASHALRGDPELHGLCFNPSVPFMAAEGGRHTALTRLVGRLTKRCVGHPWASEQFLYALLAPKIAELGDDEPWLDKLWGMICDYIAQDRAEQAARNVEVKAEVEEKAAPPPPSKLTAFCNGVRQWFPDAVGQDDEAVVEMVKSASLAIATSQEGNHNYLIQPNGFYAPYPVSPEKLSLRIRESEMEWLVQTEFEGKDNKGQPKVVKRTWPQFLDEDSRTYASAKILCVHRGNYLSQDEAGNTQFIISPFWLRDMDEVFNDQVEEWLQLAAEDGRSEDLMYALGCLLAFQYGPTAALALIGPRSVGKKLIATGLAECINTLQCCPGRALVSRFNASLMKSPIVWIDEGLPRGKDGIDFADNFRNLVTGGKLSVEPKNKEIIEVAGVHRVLITANNYEAISKLGEDAPRTQDDLDAISERLVVFNLQKRAADYLGRIDTRGWIAGDNGAPSKYTIAKHFLWHFRNTLRWENGVPVKRGRRLLYEGKPDGLVQETIDGNDPYIPEIAATVNDMIRSGQAILKDNGIYVPPEQLKNRLCGPGKPLKPSEWRRAAKALCYDIHNTTIDNVSARFFVMTYDRLVPIIGRLATLAPQLSAHIAKKSP